MGQIVEIIIAKGWRIRGGFPNSIKDEYWYERLAEHIRHREKWRCIDRSIN